MSQQQTLRQSVSYSGIGLHSGNRVTMTLLPAPPGSGIRFRRVDLEGKPEIEARIENVTQTNRSTTLARGNAKIQTVEHILATLAGYGVDNAIIELDANEPPIGDGSSREYGKMVEHAGIAPQGEARAVFYVAEPLQLQNEETLMSIFPHDRLKISCTSADKAGRFSQFFSIEITPETWKREIVNARTFCFFEEIEYLIKNGLIKGGSLENAVVIRDDAVLTTEPLRYPEEFVRHKILDIIGDLSLLGRPICGHVVAVRPSHSANCELARLLQVQIRRPLESIHAFAPPPISTQQAPAMSISEIEKMMADGSSLDIGQVMKILPHRYPFLMVDKVTRIDGNKITAMKNVTANEPYFLGHFPNYPIMPGVLQLEAIAQVAGILMLRQAENFGKLAYFMSAESVKWRKPVRPGDTVVIDVELTKSRGKIGKAKGTCLVGNEPVSEAEVTFMLIDRSE
ncbi:MAG TPA: bifunctional UDP-3-O-[3-hydroxymyristoyl] N-acetylglucosamine deacetylase/3-hydroxyacyl-ACP dehydratase [Candidatus Dormibacteraeota bacterium]|nr:bifunctional UDP-3-O-[3-hydroxymyristoyl] N-acetylglucosamine deacetylase/3-hydroxyacyl-ACP dehydratase [Candidatus Dormibacteraeota bacterium]